MTTSQTTNGCVYCHGSRGAKLSREHVISDSVLRTVFGADNRNTAYLVPAKKWLIDHEHIVRDVCILCNSDLSPYDSAGETLVRAIHCHYSGIGQSLPFSSEILGWTIKTHLNSLRTTPNRSTHSPHRVDQDIYDALVHRSAMPQGKYRLFIEGWEGQPYYWDENDERRIQYFFYRSIQYPAKQITVSNLRVKWLDTFLFLPTNGHYDRFTERAQYAMACLVKNIGFDGQEIDLFRYLTAEAIEITNVLPASLVSQWIRRRPE